MTSGLMQPRSNTHEKAPFRMPDASPVESGFFYVLQDEARILYVDDDPILREFAGVSLASDRASVALAADGVDALEQLPEVKPDIMILDLEMPRMDGFEVLRRLKNDPDWAALPVIVATGREDIVAIDQAFDLGATSFVVKPVHWRLLGYQIRYVLRSSRQAAAQPEVEVASSDLAHCVRALATEGARFIAAAVGRDPALRPEAADFADAIEHTAALTAARG